MPKASKKDQKLSGDALMEEVDGDAASTVAPSGSSRVTASSALGVSTTADALSTVDEGSGSDSVSEDLDILRGNPAALAHDNSTYHLLVREQRLWNLEQYKHLYKNIPGEFGWLLCLPTGKRVWRAGGGPTGHEISEAYYAIMKKFVMASDFFGAFYMDRMPQTMGRVPTMEEMRIAYGDRIPAYDLVSQYLPRGIRVKSGGAGLNTKVWPARAVLGMGAVYWNGIGGPTHFRGTRPHGNMPAQWSLGDASDMSVQVAEVYEDPEFSSKSRVVSENMEDVAPKMGETMERLIDPMEPHKMQDYSNKAHKYGGQMEGSLFYSTGNTGRWWPVWIVCRTKGGWWCICWYQLLDGTWVVEFWWYADVHVHLMDAAN